MGADVESGKDIGRISTFMLLTTGLAQSYATKRAIRPKADTMPAKVFPWIVVDKVRHALKFEWTEKEGSKPTPLSNMPDCGCTVEAPGLTIGSIPWWTIGFEAFGDPNHRAHNVRNELYRPCSTWPVQLLPVWCRHAPLTIRSGSCGCQYRPNR